MQTAVGRPNRITTTLFHFFPPDLGEEGQTLAKDFYVEVSKLLSKACSRNYNEYDTVGPDGLEIRRQTL
jgi:hypothetical protein